MTKVLDQLSAYLFEHFHFVRIEAHVFTENTASIRALEKAGFQKEGVLRMAFKKGEVYKDSMLFTRISEL
jgi:RimJ/RimL family protein N-acetyltransferase